jgi:hypothetical protein
MALARIGWATTVAGLVIAGAVLIAKGYVGYPIVIFTVALAGAVNLPGS